MTQGSLREFLISCPPCVETGEADWFYLKKNIGLLFCFANNFLMRHRGKFGSTPKKMLPDLIFHWVFAEQYIVFISAKRHVQRNFLFGKTP